MRKKKIYVVIGGFSILPEDEVEGEDEEGAEGEECEKVSHSQ